MKIAFLGTKGIPNNYGGFEQFVQYLSVGLANRGHKVTVYAPHYHPFQGSSIGRVRIKKFHCPEQKFGAAAHFSYDFFCLKDAIRNGFDIIYEAGYASSAIAIFLLNNRDSKYKIVTNMDGMEWKRSKWNSFARGVTKLLEKIAVRYSDFIVADNIGIKEYFYRTYGQSATYLPYGAEAIYDFTEETTASYGLKPQHYYLVIARLEPENNLEMMIKGYLKKKLEAPLVVVGGLTTQYSKTLIDQFKDYSDVRFLGSIYDKKKLDDLRHFSKVYFHGHSVGGTNPSLLEAMACSCLIFAHDNEFNRAVLGRNAIFFDSDSQLSDALHNEELFRGTEQFKSRNFEEIRTKYSWDHVVRIHENYFQSILNSAR